jgi:hypothetical protein
MTPGLATIVVWCGVVLWLLWAGFALRKAHYLAWSVAIYFTVRWVFPAAVVVTLAAWALL